MVSNPVEFATTKNKASQSYIFCFLPAASGWYVCR